MQTYTCESTYVCILYIYIYIGVPPHQLVVWIVVCEFEAPSNYQSNPPHQRKLLYNMYVRIHLESHLLPGRGANVMCSFRPFTPACWLYSSGNMIARAGQDMKLRRVLLEKGMLVPAKISHVATPVGKSKTGFTSIKGAVVKR